SRNNRLDHPTIIVSHSSFISRAVHDLLSDTELRIGERSQILNLLKKVVLETSIELGNLFGSICIGNTIFRSRQLILNLPSALFGLCSSCFILNDIRKL